MALIPPKHDAVWVRELVAELRERGHPVERLLAEVGLSESRINVDGARVSFAKHAAIFELAAETTGDDHLGLHFAETRETRNAGLIAYVGISSSNLFDTITNLSRYSRVFSDAVEIQTDELEMRGRLGWDFGGVALQRARQSSEFAAANLIRAFREVTGTELVPSRTNFAHARAKGIGEFERFFGCPVMFGRRENTIEMKLSDLHRPLVTADDRLLALLRQLCHDVLSKRSEQTPLLIGRVEQAIADRLANGEAKLDVIASEVGMSSRSLSRRLAELGTSLKSLTDDLRKKLAYRYLHETGASCTEIAFVLGYSDVSSFNHAFKRWTGQTPTAARKSQL